MYAIIGKNDQFHLAGVTKAELYCYQWKIITAHWVTPANSVSQVRFLKWTLFSFLCVKNSTTNSVPSDLMYRLPHANFLFSWHPIYYNSITKTPILFIHYHYYRYRSKDSNMNGRVISACITKSRFPAIAKQSFHCIIIASIFTHVFTSRRAQFSRHYGRILQENDIKDKSI